jgi:hypothetical protein
VGNSLIEYVLVGVEASDIQGFIFSTGQLKEMIGASQIIFELTNDLYPEVLGRLRLKLAHSPADGQNWAIAFQDKAGALRLLLPNKSVGQKFLTEFSNLALDRWPGLPLHGALTLATWTENSLSAAQKKVSDLIDDQRARWPVANGLSLIPPLEMAPLDGLPAIGRERPGDNADWLSWPSSVKRSDQTIKAANDRLQNHSDELSLYLNDTTTGELVTWPKGTLPQWPVDIDEMLIGQKNPRLALIQLDVNNLSHFSLGQANQKRNQDPGQLNLARREKASQIDRLNARAFSAALKAAVLKDLNPKYRTCFFKDNQYLWPLRPLIMDGDDFTAIVRADLAFPFLQAFVETFERDSRALGTPLSLGAGLLITPPSFPLAKAFHLVEELVSSAKKATKNVDVNSRPSSLDYLVITSDVDDDLGALRARVATSVDGYPLTGKPFVLKDNFLNSFLGKAKLILNNLPRSQTHAAINDCRQGLTAAGPTYFKLRENIQLGVGGRYFSKMNPKLKLSQFDDIFPVERGFFVNLPGAKPNQLGTYLVDYLELAGLI